MYNKAKIQSNLKKHDGVVDKDYTQEEMKELV